MFRQTFVKKRSKGRLSKNKAARWSASQGVLNLLVHEAKVNEVLTDYCMRPGGIFCEVLTTGIILLVSEALSYQ